MPIPDSLPAFRSIRVDQEGWVWAELYTWDTTKPLSWMIFDPSGQAQGVLETPPGIEVQSIGYDFVLGVSRDEFGVESVHRYRLQRGAEG